MSTLQSLADGTERNSSGILRTLDASVLPMLDVARAASVLSRDSAKDYFYFAAGLFNNDQLAGNLLLGGEIIRLSGERFVPDFPQNKESNTDVDARHPHNIRAKDLKGVLLADMALFMFESMNLDEGMLIELGFAKALGIPTVVVRTDFRKAGDQEGNISENWNLMCSDWPLHRVVISCSIAEYGKSVGTQGATLIKVLSDLYTPVARKVTDAFDELRTQEPLISGSLDFLTNYYLTVIKTYDGSGRVLEAIGRDEVALVVQRKIEKGLLKLV